MAFAEGTTVELETSVSQIVTMVRRAGGERVGQFHDNDKYHVWFTLDERQMRFSVPLVLEYSGPSRSGNGRAIDQRKWIDQRNRQKGRALMLVIKAKLESVESGVETLEQAFLANIVMADGKTVYERIQEPLAIEYAGGVPDTLLIGQSS